MELVKWQNGTKPLFTGLLDEFFNKDPFFNSGGSSVATAAPAVNIRETENDFIVELAAPGMKKDDFEVQLDHSNLLTISSTMHRTDEETEGNYRRKEFNFSAFKRSFTLPDTIQADKISAEYKDGLLMLTIPKKEEAKQLPPRTIKIK